MIGTDTQHSIVCRSPFSERQGMNAIDSQTSPAGLSDWLLEAAIGLIVLVLGVTVWVVSHYSDNKPVHDRPKPVWLGMSKVMAQMSDGRMVSMKINLKLSDDEAVKELDPHMPAFKSLIQDAGAKVTREDLQERDGLKHFSAALRGTLNGYLEDHDVSGRVKDIAFEEFMLMP